jgi:outer membrane protein assembly factor BamB
VAASGDGNIYGLDLATGDLRWTIPRVTGRSLFPMAADRDFRPLAVAAGVLISGSLTGEVIGYDLDTRAERWRFTAIGLGSSAFRIASVNDVMYVPFANGMLVALRAADGQELWRIGDWTSGFLWPPAVREHTLFLTGAGDGMSAVRVDP